MGGDVWTVKEIFQALKNKKHHGKTIVVPMFQRGKRWNSEKEDAFIDSLKRGYPVGAMLFFETIRGEEMVYTLVDGLQRSNTIRKYMNTPTDFIAVSGISEESLDEICLILNLDPSEGMYNRIRETINSSIRKVKDFSDVQAFQVTNDIVEKFSDPEHMSMNKSNEISALILPYINNLKVEYEKIVKVEIPVIVYRGDIKELPAIFDRINSKGVALSPYEVYAAAWPQGRDKYINDHEIIKYVMGKYDVLVRDGFQVEGYDRNRLNSEKMLNSFEYLFGLGKKLCNQYRILSFGNMEDDTVNTMGFELLNACFNESQDDIGHLYEQILPLDINLFGKRLDEAINFVLGIIGPVIRFKGNFKDQKRQFVPHGKYQIISIVSFVFREMYDWRKLDKLKDGWPESKKTLEKTLLQHYVYDIVSKQWSQGSQSRLFAVNRSKAYLNPVGFGKWENALNTYFTNQVGRKEKVNVAPPKNEDMTILNCIYLSSFTALDQLQTNTFDIEHLAAKQLMKDLIIKTESAGLPVSSIGNICYLPTNTNRSKGKKTIYQWAKKHSDIDIALIESKYSFTDEDDLKWISKNYGPQMRFQFEEAYFQFIRRRFVKQKKRLYEVLGVDFKPDAVSEPTETASTEIQPKNQEKSKKPKKANLKKGKFVGRPIGDTSIVFNGQLPDLPSEDLPAGLYVRTALENLLNSGFVFSENQIRKFTVTNEDVHIKRNLPIMLVLNEGESKKDVAKQFENKGAKKKADIDRYWSVVFCDGVHRFLFFSQWYPDSSEGASKPEFREWYNSLLEE